MNFLAALESCEYDDPDVVEDGAGKLWLATWGGGIHRLDPKTGGWKTYRHRAEETSSLIQDSVFTLFCIARCARGPEPKNGLNAFDFTTERFQIYRVTELGNNSERAIGQDFHGALWLATLYTGVHGLDPEIGAFTVYRYSDAPGSFANDAASSICVDHDGTVRAGPTNGLNRFDQANGRFTAYHESEAHFSLNGEIELKAPRSNPKSPLSSLAAPFRSVLPFVRVPAMRG